MTTKITRDKVTVPVKQLLDLIWMARRYAHGRKTYAPGLFNDAHRRCVVDNELKERDDSHAVPSFPKAE